MAKKYVKSKCVKLNLVAIFNECKQIRAWNCLTKGTRDTTQEPQDGGQSIVVLSSILSGYSDETGARCNLVDGYYTDEEISLLAPGLHSVKID